MCSSHDNTATNNDVVTRDKRKQEVCDFEPSKYLSDLESHPLIPVITLVSSCRKTLATHSEAISTVSPKGETHSTKQPREPPFFGADLVSCRRRHRRPDRLMFLVRQRMIPRMKQRYLRVNKWKKKRHWMYPRRQQYEYPQPLPLPNSHHRHHDLPYPPRHLNIRRFERQHLFPINTPLLSRLNLPVMT